MNTTKEQNRPVVVPEIIELYIPEAETFPASIVVKAEAPSQKWPTEIIVTVIACAAIISLIYWKRSLLPNVSPYVTIVITAAIGLGQLAFKDWHNYKRKWVRGVLVTIIVAAAAVGLLNQYQQIRDRRVSEARAEKLQAASEARAQASEQAQRDNTQIFQKSFDKLSGQFADFKTKVATKDLQDQLAAMKGELSKTQAALIGPPPIAFQYSLLSFMAPGQAAIATPVSRVTLTVDSDGVVHVPFYVYNPSDRAALNGDLHLTLCDDCKFAKEPKGFRKIEGDVDNHRILSFDHIQGQTNILDLSADVIPPGASASFDLGLMIKCPACVPGSQHIMTVQLIRDFVKQFPKK